MEQEIAAWDVNPVSETTAGDLELRLLLRGTAFHTIDRQQQPTKLAATAHSALSDCD
jgi:hypothetical protein